MGVYVVATVENRHGLSYHEFIDAFERDEWGKYIQFGKASLSASWDMFPWQGNTYFVWTDPPRIDYLGIYNAVSRWDDDVAAGRELSRGRIQEDQPVHLTFLKVMFAAEMIAGGPVYVGEDVGNFFTPGGAKECEGDYELPLKLEDFIPNWRDIALIEVREPLLRF